jgi:hypothetical protein
VALYSFENFFCTYWFMSDVLPTLQQGETRVSDPCPTKPHVPARRDGAPAVAQDNDLQQLALLRGHFCVLSMGSKQQQGNANRSDEHEEHSTTAKCMLAQVQSKNSTKPCH